MWQGWWNFKSIEIWDLVWKVNFLADWKCWTFEIDQLFNLLKINTVYLPIREAISGVNNDETGSSVSVQCGLFKDL